MKKTFKEIGGTSFHDTTINCSLSILRKVLGEPEYSGNDGEGKINFEWEMETDSGDVFTVYDWKYKVRLLNDKIVGVGDSVIIKLGNRNYVGKIKQVAGPGLS